MDLPEAATYILKVFAAIDGEIPPEEDALIEEFINANFSLGTIDYAEWDYLEHLGNFYDFETAQEILLKSAGYFIEARDNQKKALMDLVYKLITADHVIKVSERMLFSKLAEYLDMELEGYDLSHDANGGE